MIRNRQNKKRNGQHILARQKIDKNLFWIRKNQESVMSSFTRTRPAAGAVISSSGRYTVGKRLTTALLTSNCEY
jgi:hypothetical protein